jgi:hypothetical protein
MQRLPPPDFADRGQIFASTHVALGLWFRGQSSGMPKADDDHMPARDCTETILAGANRDQAGRAAPTTDVLNETLERLHLLLRDLALAWHVDRQGLGRVINGLRVAAVPQREPPR